LACLLLCFVSSCRNSSSDATNTTEETIATPAINYSLTATFPHDTTSFTEGLLFYNGKLYEATGSPNELPQTRSVFGAVDLQTGKIITKIELDRAKYFGE